MCAFQCVCSSPQGVGPYLLSRGPHPQNPSCVLIHAAHVRAGGISAARTACVIRGVYEQLHSVFALETSGKHPWTEEGLQQSLGFILTEGMLLFFSGQNVSSLRYVEAMGTPGRVREGRCRRPQICLSNH